MEVQREVTLPDFGYVGLGWVDCLEGNESIMLKHQLETPADLGIVNFAITSHPQTIWQQPLHKWYRFGVRLHASDMDAESQLFAVAHEIFDDIRKQACAPLCVGYQVEPQARTLRRHRGRYPVLQTL